MILDVPTENGILRFMWHSQAVERSFKFITEASAAMCGNGARDEFIISRIASRIALPKFETKS
jgi:hypothetical protein